MQKSWHSLLGEGRSGKDIHQEKETKLFLRLPGCMLSLAIKLVRWLDARHWLPGFMTDPDPMYTSCVMANLGSVGLAAGYHHLYEYGNCPFFTVIGRVRKDPVAVDGEVEIRPRVDMKITFAVATLLLVIAGALPVDDRKASAQSGCTAAKQTAAPTSDSRPTAVPKLPKPKSFTQCAKK